MMAVRYTYNPPNLAQLIEDLALEGDAIDAAVDVGLEAGGAVLLTGMQRRVPWDTHNLQNHLEMSAVQREGNNHFVEVGMANGIDAETARYGNAQEYGWADKEGAQAGQPYIRPTFDEDARAAWAATRAAIAAYPGPGKTA